MYYDWPDYSGLPFSLVEHTFPERSTGPYTILILATFEKLDIPAFWNNLGHAYRYTGMLELDIEELNASSRTCTFL